MPCFPRLALALVLLGLSGCARVSIDQHLAAKDYAGSPARIFIVNLLDASFEAELPGAFATAITAMLARCNVSVMIHRPDSMELDAEARLKARVEAFKADSGLLIRQTVQSRVDNQVRGGSYIATLSDIREKRDVWKAQINMSAAVGANRTVVAQKLADLMVRQMVADNVLKTCPPFPPADS